LRRVDSLHVACWIRSSSSGDVLRVVGRFLSSLTRCERSGQNSKDHRRDPYHVVSDYWVYHCEYLLLIDLRIVPGAVFRSEGEFFGLDRVLRRQLSRAS
jgi:hypothetical protein